MKYYSIKKYGHDVGLSCAFRQPNASSHCKYIHGYALSFKFVFGCNDLDENNWVVDFGGLKLLKEWLQKTFDHKVVIDKDDEQLQEFILLEQKGLCQLVLMNGVGCEAFAKYTFEWTNNYIKQLTSNRCWVVSCEVKEHGANGAIVKGE